MWQFIDYLYVFLRFVMETSDCVSVRMRRISSQFWTGTTGVLISTGTDWFEWVPRVDAVFLDHLSQDIRGTNSSAVWRYLIAYKNLLRSIENIGIAVVYGIRSPMTLGLWLANQYSMSGTMPKATCLRISTSRFYKKNILSYLFTIPFTQFIRHDTLGFEYLDQSKNFAPQVRS